MPSEPLPPLPPRRDQAPKPRAKTREEPKPWSGLNNLASTMAAFAWLNLAAGVFLAFAMMSAAGEKPSQMATIMAAGSAVSGVIAFLIFLSLASVMRGVVRMERRQVEGA